MTTDWAIDELRYAGAEHLDEGFVAGFDDKQGRPAADEDIAALIAQGVGHDALVVDVGAGTGQFAVPASAHFDRVVAVDVSAAMLARLDQRAAGLGIANIQCVQAGFLSYRHEGAPADAIYSRHALHQLPDFWKALALARMADVVKPGGVLRLRDLVYDFQPHEAEEVFGAWLEGAATDPAQGYTTHDYVEHIRGEFSTFRWLLEPMLAAAGFEVVAVSFHGRLYGAYTCVKREMPAGGEVPGGRW